jgi:putative membrane protein
MRTKILSAIAVFALLSLPILAKSHHGSANRADETDQAFLAKAFQANMFEIELGNLAQRSSNPMVKQYAQRMVTDHTNLQNQLKTVASAQGVTLPTTVTPSDRATIDRLSKLSGADFDREYINTMVKDHKEDISEFHHEATMGTMPTVKTYAANALPTLHEHLTLAENAQKTVG